MMWREQHRGNPGQPQRPMPRHPANAASLHRIPAPIGQLDTQVVIVVRVPDDQLQRPHEGAEHATVEDEAGVDDVGALPAVLLEEEGGEGGEDEGAHAGAAHGDARGEGAAPFKVVAGMGYSFMRISISQLDFFIFI